MKKNQNQTADAAELRRRAEERLQARKQPPRSAEDTGRLVHELQVHQIELEMQNEELQQSRAKTETLLAQYTGLYDFAPVGYLTLDRDGAIRQVNLTGARLLGLEHSRLVNRRFGLFVAEADRPAFNAFLQKVFARHATGACEVALAHEGPHPWFVRIEGAVTEDGRECRVVVVDLTARRQAEDQARAAQAEAQRLLALSEQTRRALLNAVEDEKQTAEQLRASEEQFRESFYRAAVGKAQADAATGRFLRVNPAFCEFTGYTEAELLGKTFIEITLPEDREADAAILARLFRREIPSFAREKRYVRKDGAVVWGQVSVTMIFDADGRASLATAVIQDITARKRAEALVNGQKQVLEMVAAGAPLAESLTALVRLIEAQAPGMLGSVLLLDEDGVHVRHSAAPNLPAEFVAVVDGQPIGPCAGSCGTAAYRKEPVFVADIATDPLWAEYKAAALPHGLRACWSTPIFDAHRRVLGTFAMYYRQPGLPQPEHLRLLDLANHTAAIAINRHRTEAALRESEGKYRLLTESLQDLVYRADPSTWVATFVNRAVEALYGYSVQEWLSNPRLWEDTIHPDDRPQVLRVLADAQRAGENSAVEYRIIRKDGDPRWVVDSFVWERDPQGNIVSLNGIVTDITARKEAEAALQEQLDELRRWQTLMLDREERQMELKREINDLCRRAGEPARYPSQEE